MGSENKGEAQLALGTGTQVRRAAMGAGRPRSRACSSAQPGAVGVQLVQAVAFLLEGLGREAAPSLREPHAASLT